MLYSVVLVSAEQRSESATCIPMPLPPGSPSQPALIPPIWATTEDQAELPFSHVAFLGYWSPLLAPPDPLSPWSALGDTLYKMQPWSPLPYDSGWVLPGGGISRRLQARGLWGGIPSWRVSVGWLQTLLLTPYSSGIWFLPFPSRPRASNLSTTLMLQHSSCWFPLPCPPRYR